MPYNLMRFLPTRDHEGNEVDKRPLVKPFELNETLYT